MGDMWSGETDYDRNQGKRDARDAARDKAKNDETMRHMQNYINNPGGGFVQYGSTDEKARQASALSQVGAMTGQNMFQAGQQQQDYLNSLQNRRNGGDAVAQYMMGEKNRSMANINRGMAGKGVASTAAMATANSAGNKADESINKQKQGFGRQNDQDLWNYVKRNQKVTGDALAMGSEQGLADGIDVSSGSGMFGTVICTELHRQGLMSDEIYEKDAEYGKFLAGECPTVIRGYHLFGVPLARKMKTSPRLTKLIKPFGLAWAKHIAGEDNILGMFIFMIGVPVCFTLGLFVPTRKVAHV